MSMGMGPPPPKTLTLDTDQTSSNPTAMKPPMAPPPENPEPNNSDTLPEATESSTTTTTTETPSSSEEAEAEVEAEASQSQSQSEKVAAAAVPYTIPPWSAAPCHRFYLEVLKDGSIIDQFQVNDKGAYMFGRVDLCDFVLDHPTVSRFHAVIQFKRNGDAYLYDLGSTHGTSINKSQVKKRVYMDLRVGDVIRFGLSSRLYIFQGPSELMPPEADVKIIRDAKIREGMLDREASLQRARREASLADGVSWGMGEDAIEEEEDDADEVTWQTYKGQLTEKQEKTRDKILKRTEKASVLVIITFQQGNVSSILIAHMKKEIEAIRAKDISQGGLTQGQQTQIARNEQRMTQILEELENLEETLNDSIRESLGARGKISHGKKKGATEDDEEYSSDDDEFYDRTKKPSQKAGENQSIETADTLLAKRDAIMKEMENKKELLSIEKNKMASETAAETEVGDALDAFMSGLSSQLVLDKSEKLEKELSALQSEMDRICYLLKIADPAGDAAKKRDLKLQEQKANKLDTPVTVIKKQPPMASKESSGPEKQVNGSMLKEVTTDAIVESSKKLEAVKIVSDTTEGKTSAYTVVKPQWLGAVEDRLTEETQQAAPLDLHEPDDFVDYKDRKNILASGDGTQTNAGSGIESAAPGLIIRKKKPVKNPEGGDYNASQLVTSSSSGPELMAEDAVALLLKHKRGYYEPDDEERNESQDTSGVKQLSKDNKKPKRMLGPEKPTFLDSNSDYEAWVPPEGQTGDGRTSLNERLGY
ncbi:protein phosphatase 1 regulatory inhibitor subunit ppp1r8 like protein [Quercus suber]|uniref:Protein phosphatase 1 regulatory inhibitor subunit ppp1r8 like protein n=1 Tax=Quercus suber TaxID=58331 RepID=A0AAW0J3D0_QUESU